VSILAPLIPGIRQMAAVRPLLVACDMLANPYFAAWRRLPLNIGSFDLSYFPAFYALGAARRELMKTKFRRRLARYRAEQQGYAHLYTS